MDNIFSSAEYKRSRKAYMTQCTAEHLIGLLVLDAFLAKLLTYLGVSDSLVGVISGFASFAFMFQLLSIFLVQLRFSTKKIVIAGDVASQLLFAFIYLVPFIPLNGEVKKIIVAGSIMIAYACKNTISSLYFKWANSYVDDGNRAVFSAKKECISLITGIIFSAVMGYVVDRFEAVDSLSGGLLFVAIAMLIINVINWISLMSIKDESASARSSMRVPFKEVGAHIAKNKIFKSYMLINILAKSGAGLVAGFVGVYKIKELAMTIFAVQIINVIGDFMRMIFTIPISKYSTKKGFAHGIQLASILDVSAYIMLIFTTPGTRWLVVLYTFLIQIGLAASYQNSFNICYTLLPQKYMVQAMAVSNTADGIFAFLSAVVGGMILGFIQKNGNMIFGMEFYGQQFLAILASLVTVTVLILRKKYVIKPIDEMKNKVEK